MKIGPLNAAVLLIWDTLNAATAADEGKARPSAGSRAFRPSSPPLSKFLKDGGSKRLTNGGGQAKLHEPGDLTSPRFYAVSWERESLDLTELARLRWIERWRLERIAAHFNCSRSAVKAGIRNLRAYPDLADIEFGHRKRRPWAITRRSFRGK